MKKTLIVFALPLTMLCAAEKKAAAKQPASQAQAQTKTGAPKIPAGAVKTDLNTYSYTDAAGKKWIYRETPFGVVKMEDKPVAALPPVEETNPVVITDLGDSVKFARRTPFGQQSWTKKKADLTDDEKAQVAKSASPDSGGKAPEKQ